jgi:cytidyltransferase-like protein
MDPLDKEILKLIYRENLEKGECKDLIRLYPLNLIPKKILNEHIERLRKKGLIDSKSYKLTKKGRENIKVGLLGGVFDIVHVGHIESIKEAKRYVDILVIVIARDKTVYKNKNRYPINNEIMRLYVIKEFKDVDIAILGDERDFMKPVMKIEPDIIFLGYDQSLPDELKDKLSEKVSIVQLSREVKGIKTTYIIRRLREIFQV